MKVKKKTVFNCDICNKHFDKNDLLQAHKRIHSTSHSYSCEQCDFKSAVPAYLTRHVRRMHGGERNHVCGVCGKEYLWRSKLMHHMLVHTGEKPYKCVECGKAFNTHYSLNTHKFIHTNEKPYKCEYCAYACRDSSTLRKHNARHTGQQKLYKCKLCPKTVINKWKLKHHIAEVHLQLDIRKHQCDTCDQRFKLKANLSKHIKSVHEKSTRVACEVCGAEISSRSNLSVHMMTHVDAKPYMCTYDGCGKTYRDGTGLRRHEMVHYPEQLPACEICDKKLSSASRLKKHLLQHVPRSKTLECHHCGARFFNKSYLTKHIRCKHTGERQSYVCDECGLLTHNKPSIVMHIKYGHVSENDRQCKRCNKTFKRNVYLKLHYIRVHGIRYKTKKRKPMVVIKEEPDELDDQQSIDLFEIEKHELLDELDRQLKDPEPEAAPEELKTQEELAEHIIKDNRKQLNKIPDTIFDDIYIDSFVDIQDEGEIEKKKPGRKSVHHIDRATQEQARKSVRILLARVRQKEEARTLERTRRQYNERMRAAGGGNNKGDIKVKFFNNNQPKQSSCKKRKEKKSHNDSLKKKSLNNNKNNTERGLEKNINENEINITNYSFKGESTNDRLTNEANKKNDDDLPQNKSLYSKSNEKQSKDCEIEGNRNELKKIINDNKSSNDQFSNGEEKQNNLNVPKDINDSSQDKQTNGNGSEELKERKNYNQCADSEESELDNDEEDDDNDSSQDKTIDDDKDSDWEGETIKRNKNIRKRTQIGVNTRKRSKNKANDKNDDDSSSNESFRDKQAPDESDSDWKEEEIPRKKKIKKSNKIIFNTHQCYTCFKLYETKEKLLEHCKDHFDVCNNTSLKKCPLCDYVSKHGLPRHMKLRHDVLMRVPYANMKDKKHNENGSRYYFEVDNPKFNKIEVIPSVRNLNKIACTKIDKRNREARASVVAKTKLVKKGKEWIVIKEKIKVNADEFILPEMVNEEFKVNDKNVSLNTEKNDCYMDRMKRLSVLAKKNGKKMMFPCDKCDKICQNLAALKLHSRKHDPNAKPFKPRGWKLKQKAVERSEATEKARATEKLLEDHRNAKPKPIINKHKCDPELKKFYEDNIRGKDIEFWQFLKIFNKMDRENVKDFGDLETRIDFGIHTIGVNAETEAHSAVAENGDKNGSKPETLAKVTKKVSANVTKRVNREEQSAVAENGDKNSTKPETLAKVAKKVSANVTKRVNREEQSAVADNGNKNSSKPETLAKVTKKVSANVTKRVNREEQSAVAENGDKNSTKPETLAKVAKKVSANVTKRVNREEQSAVAENGDKNSSKPETLAKVAKKVSANVTKRVNREEQSAVAENGDKNSSNPETLAKVAKKVSANVTKRVNTKKNAYRRVIRLSRKDYLRRNAIKNELRQKLAKQQT